MSIYICLKPVTLYGIQYEPGDVIHSEAVLPTRIRALKNQGVIIESSLSDKGPLQPGDNVGDVSDGGTAGDGSDDEPGGITGGGNEGHQRIADILAEGTAMLMMQVLDNRKAVNVAIRAQEKGGAL